MIPSIPIFTTTIHPDILKDYIETSSVSFNSGKVKIND